MSPLSAVSKTHMSMLADYCCRVEYKGRRWANPNPSRAPAYDQMALFWPMQQLQEHDEAAIHKSRCIYPRSPWNLLISIQPRAPLHTMADARRFLPWPHQRPHLLVQLAMLRSPLQTSGFLLLA